MKRVLLLITLAMFTFTVGHAQFDIKTQPGYDAQMEEIFGQAPVSEDLPSVMNFSSMMKGDRATWIGYGSLIPSSGSYSGKFYEIDFASGTIKNLKSYPSYYFTSAEYVEGTVYVFCNDFTKGYGTLNIETGVYSKIAKISKGMTDLTYNHNNGKMYGLRYGKIWEINMADGSAKSQVTTENNYIAIACDTYGNMYAVTQNTTANASLVKFAGCDFSQPQVVKSDIGYKTQYTQSMAYDHNTDKLVWWQVSGEGKHIIELNPANGNVISAASTSTSVGGLFFKFSNKEHNVTFASMTGGTATANPTSAKKGATITVTATPENCNEVATVTTAPETTVTPVGGGVYTFPMPSEDVKVSVTFTEHPVIESVVLSADKQVLCYGNTATLTATVTGGEATSFDWYNGTEKKATTTANTYNAGEGVWHVVATTAYGCDGTSNDLAVAVEPEEVETPVVTGPSTVCSGNEITLSLDEWQGSEELNIVWKNGETKLGEGINMTEITIENVTEALAVTATAIEHFEVEELGSIDCSATSEVFTVSVNELPSVSITATVGSETLCYGKTLTLAANVPTKDAEPYAYQWTKDGADIEDATTSTYTIESATPDDNAGYNVKVTINATGCYATAANDFTLTVHEDLADLTITSTADVICAGGEVTFTTANVEGYSYTWYKDEVAIAGASTYTYTMTDAEVGTYSITVEAGFEGCTKTSEAKALTVNALPTVTITEGTSGATCSGSGDYTLNATATPEGSYTFTWKAEGLLEDEEEGETLTFSVPEVATTTDYTITVVGKDEAGCENKATYTLTVNALPTVALEETAEMVQVCYGGSYTLHVKDADATLYDYQWYKDDEILVGETGTSYTKLDAQEDANGFVSVIATLKSTGCASEPASMGINVVEAAEAPTVDGPEDAICYNYSTTLEYGYNGEKDDYIFFWYQKAGEEWVLKQTTKGAEVDRVTYETEKLTVDTQFKLALTHVWAQEESGCYAESEVYTVAVKPNTPVETKATDGTKDLIFVEDHYNSCVGSTYEVIAEEGFDTYQWYKFNGTEYVKIEGAEGNIYTEESVSELGDYKYQVVVTDETECEFLGEITVRINELPVIEITEAEIVEEQYYMEACVGVETTIHATGADTYEWGAEPEEGITVSFVGGEFTFTAQEATDYVIWVTGGNSTTECSNSTIVMLTVNPLPEVAITSPEEKEYDMIEGVIDLTATVGGETVEGGTFTLDGEDYNEATIDLMLLAEGSHTVTYTYADEKGCENTATVAFTIAPKKYWSDADIRQGGWYEDTPDLRYEIGSAEEFGYLVYLLNETTEDFNGKIIHFVNDINLGARFVKPHTGFKGLIEGYGKIISNYTVCDEIDGEIANNGIIRNLGISNAKIYATSESDYKAVTGVNFVNNGGISNCYITSSTFRFMGEASFTIKNASDAVISNFYLADSKVLNKAPLNIVNDGTMDNLYSKPAVDFGGIQIPEFTDDATLMADLNEWVDNLNIENYFDWRIVDTINNGHPVHEEFAHMVHYDVDLMHVLGGTGDIKRSNIQEYEDGTYDLVIKRNKEYGVGGDHIVLDSTIYGFAYDTVTVNVNPDLYCKLGSLKVVTDEGVEVEPYTEGEYTYFCMPVASLEIYTDIVKDYWTDEEYASFEWYEGPAASDYRITDAAQLAGLARIVNGINLEEEDIEQYDFAGKVVRIEDNINLSGHMWKPIDGFKGILEGYGKTISNMRSIDDAAALFANVGNSAVIRNLGITDAYVETSYKPEPEKTMPTNGGAAIAVNNAGSIINCYVTKAEINGMDDVTGIAVANNVAGGQVKNVYGAKIKGNVESFIALNEGTSASNFVETETTETGVTQFTDKVELTGSLNVTADALNMALFTTAPAYFPWENRDGENEYYSVFTEEPHYYLTYTNDGNGTVSGVTHSKAEAMITVTTTPNTGYEVATLTYQPNGEEAVDIENNTFEMPGANVTVAVTFSMIDWGITYEADENGEINGPEVANYGETVYVSVMPNEGFELDEVTFDVAGVEYNYADNSFVMPNSGIEVTATFKNIQYMVACTEPANGTIRILPDTLLTTTGIYEQTIGVLVTPATGYKLKTLKYQRLDTYDEFPILYNEEEEEYQFEMPAAGVIVDAEFDNINYAVKYTVAENGTISGNPTAIYEEDVTVTVNPAEGYELTYLAYIAYSAADSTAIDMDSKTFVMPADSVTVAAKFDGVYRNIAIAEIENGTVTTTPASKQRYTHDVTITVTPDNGYVLDYITVTKTGDVETVEVVNNTFEMPNFDVTINAVFKEGFWTDLGIRDTKWYTSDPTATEYHFTTANELGGLSYLVNGFDADSLVNFAGVTFYIDNAIDMHTYKWKPIGGQVKTTYTFKGNIEGNGYAITDMTTEDPKGSYQAFVGVNDGKLNNLNIHGVASGKYWVAGIAGKNNGTITNCVSNVKVISVFEAAGIAAYNFGTIENCYNRGDIENTSASFGGKASLNVGGITATNAKGGIIRNVYNVGKLVGTGSSPVSYFGGIVGKNTTGATVEKAYWLNTIAKGVGTGKIDASCKSFTPEDGQSADGLVMTLNNYVGESEVLLKWGLNPGEYLYPMFIQNPKGGEIANVGDNDININFYPNPANSYVNIECEGIQRVTVFNTLGQVLIDQNYDNDYVRLDVHSLTPGMYTVNIVTTNGITAKNLVVTR